MSRGVSVTGRISARYRTQRFVMASLRRNQNGRWWVAVPLLVGACVHTIELGAAGTDSEASTGDPDNTVPPPTGEDTDGSGEDSAATASTTVGELDLPPPSPRAMAEVLCDAQAQCGCLGSTWGQTYEGCMDRWMINFERLFVDGQSQGLHVSEDCYRQYMDNYFPVDCSLALPVADSWAWGDPECNLFEGTAQEGERCEDDSSKSAPYLGVNPCAAGLYCDSAGNWADRCAPRRGVGERCSSDFYCREELVCVQSRCANPPSVGDPCGRDCVSNLMLCDTECGDDLVCDRGSCRGRLSPGQPCTAHDQCRSLQCELSGVCGQLRAVACYDRGPAKWP